MKITSEEIAAGLRNMGIEAARDRLNYFKQQGAISDAEYVRLWHLISGGDSGKVAIGKTTLFKDDPDLLSDDDSGSIGFISILVFLIIFIGIIGLLWSGSYW